MSKGIHHGMLRIQDMNIRSKVIICDIPLTGTSIRRINHGTLLQHQQYLQLVRLS